MELKRETITKALDWLDSLVGNSNDSDIAMFTYQLLGILYDTCEELTEEVNDLKEDKELYSVFCEDYKKQIEDLKAISKQYQKQFEDCYEEKAKLTEENERLRGILLQFTDIVHKWGRKMQERLKQAICDNTYPDFNKDGKPINVWKATTGYDAIDQIAKEMVEGAGNG